MSAVLRSLPSHAPRTAEGVLAEVNALVDQLRARAPETERATCIPTTCAT